MHRLHIITSFLNIFFEIYNFEWEWDWPEWFNLEVLFEFFEDPWAMVDEAILHVIEMLGFLDLDLIRLLEASRDLLKLNTVYLNQKV